MVHHDALGCHEEWKEGLGQGHDGEDVDFVESSHCLEITVDDGHREELTRIVEEDVESATAARGDFLKCRLD